MILGIATALLIIARVDHLLHFAKQSTIVEVLIQIAFIGYIAFAMWFFNRWLHRYENDPRYFPKDYFHRQDDGWETDIEAYRD